MFQERRYPPVHDFIFPIRQLGKLVLIKRQCLLIYPISKIVKKLTEKWLSFTNFQVQLLEKLKFEQQLIVLNSMLRNPCISGMTAVLNVSKYSLIATCCRRALMSYFHEWNFYHLFGGKCKLQIP